MRPATRDHIRNCMTVRLVVDYLSVPAGGPAFGFFKAPYTLCNICSTASFLNSLSAHELPEDFLVAVHPVDNETLEGLLEDVTEVVF